MNMGDMLVKTGDPATARKVYANAKPSPTYAGWPYRAVLEQPLTDAETHVAGFRAGTGTPIRIASGRPGAARPATACASRPT